MFECSGIVVSIWTLLGFNGNDTFTGVYKVNIYLFLYIYIIEIFQILIYMDGFLNIGQGIIVFLIFGFDPVLMKEVFQKLKHIMKRGKFESQWMN